MKIAPISFSGRYKVEIGDKSGISKEGLKNELTLAQEAKIAGVSVPEYKLAFSYVTKGEKADYNKNPINKKHLENVYKNIYLMDKNGINHNDLDIGHVFYSDDNVEFDCFRFGSHFAKRPWQNYNLPEFMMPSNQLNYENASLAAYVEQIPDVDKKIEFSKMYFEAGAESHSRKANWLASKVFENENEYGIKYTPQMLEYEKNLSKALLKPNDDMALLFLDKLNFLKQQRDAFTEYDEGNGACGHPFDKQRRIKAIPMYLDAAKSAINYSIKANSLKDNSNSDLSKYYDYEAQTGKYFANKYVEWVQGMARYNFEDERVCPKSHTKTRELDAKYQQIIDADYAHKPKAIDDYINLYNYETDNKN